MGLDTYGFVISRSPDGSEGSVVSLLQTKPPREACACSLESIFNCPAVESQILRLGDFGLARNRWFLLYLSCWLSGSNSVVECQLPKLDVAGSSPVSRSIFSITWELSMFSALMRLLL